MATLKTVDATYDIKQELDQVKARLEDRYNICTTFETQQKVTNIYYAKFMKRFFVFIVFQLLLDLGFVAFFLYFLHLHLG